MAIGVRAPATPLNPPLYVTFVWQSTPHSKHSDCTLDKQVPATPTPHDDMSYGPSGKCEACLVQNICSLVQGEGRNVNHTALPSGAASGGKRPANLLSFCASELSAPECSP